SSVEAFARTLEVHARAATARLDGLQRTYLPAPPARDTLDDPEGAADEALSDAALDEQEDAFVEGATINPPAEALALLDQMRVLAGEVRGASDARVRELARWIGEHLCPGGAWNGRRVVIFTEYDDTLRWLARQLPLLLDTADVDGRIERYHGGMGDARRDALKRAFNTHPDVHPLRVLLATDAAREGINLQAHCTDLFHYDLPWNPARVEQRN